MLRGGRVVPTGAHSHEGARAFAQTTSFTTSRIDEIAAIGQEPGYRSTRILREEMSGADRRPRHVRQLRRARWLALKRPRDLASSRLTDVRSGRGSRDGVYDHHTAWPI